MTLKSSEWLKSFAMALGYFAVLYFVQFFFNKIGLAKEVPGELSLMRYDAGIYEDIMRNGYSFAHEQYNNTGQYPLFSWFWRLLHVGIQGISIVNIFLFSIGFAIVCGLYRVSTIEKFLWLTTPSLYFMAVPYTEALFCLLTALSFYGINKGQKSIIWISLFLLSLTRATTIFLIPSLLIMEILTNERRFVLKALRCYLVNYAFPVITGLLVFVLVQYSQTGIWFAYYKQQIKYLGHEWAFPNLPFQNFYGENRILWLSGLAMLVCVVAGGLLVFYTHRWLLRNRKNTDKVLILSLAYLPIVLFCIVFCNPTWGSSNTTNLLGLHRYTLCTPFIFVFLYFIRNTINFYKPKHFIFVFVLCNLVWLSVGSYIHLQQLLFWNFITLIVFGYMLHTRKHEWATLALIAMNAFLQLNLYQQFLNGLFTD